MRTLLLTFLLWTVPVSAAGIPRFDPVTIAGTSMQLPRGWQRQQDDSSLVLTENPADPESPVLALIAVQAVPGQTPSAATVADTILGNLDLPAQGIRAELIDQRSDQGALYRLHRLDKQGQPGYLVGYTHTDPRQGTVVHMLFSAMEARFVALGGPALPLVVYAGMDPKRLQQMQQNSQVGRADHCEGAASFEACLADHHFRQLPASTSGSLSDQVAARCQAAIQAARGPAALARARADCEREVAQASQILRMGHETRMKIIHNLGGGWCYRGESGCD
ncbi:MAG: hypothetical protein MUE46_00160 [Xanthomonadales bacterium]|jgi:hypothetical protein|nr:hypothetical protein [Xanthomonadales bacterium]